MRSGDELAQLPDFTTRVRSRREPYRPAQA
jgi:hypothetical protein